MGFPTFGNLYQHLLLVLPFTSVPESFNYDNPNEWFQEYPQCIGFKQSPIAINTHKSYNVNLPPLIYGYYDDLFEELLLLKNNGHTIEFEIPKTILGGKPFITGGLLSSIYEAQAAHFHWGSSQQKGSEHMLNGKRYDLEMHIVHKNSKYKDLKEAREYEDGIAVVAVLFKVVKSPNVYYPALNDIYNTLPQLVHYNSSSSTSQFLTLGALLGNINREDYFTYKGSLTTPPCSEAVTWHIFPEVVPISYLELPKFWQILDKRGQLLLNNFRPLQLQEHRKVFHQNPHLNHIF
ncbi:carbonic anhydrase 2-like [Teleopsis dalmanni]|uniref:carbonic anhydrase 2-like n=1 Tax=Teleopsis dalmanni TaxID=139649 RepID=UPI0018CCA4E3|nr:carbonic anhydrase 2-like [Teleopsis dalmanni]XP_037943605.1 carbonic anhydrase 2-like [Teleopsis dalmanni]